jgi:hypothetical protein
MRGEHGDLPRSKSSCAVTETEPSVVNPGRGCTAAHLHYATEYFPGHHPCKSRLIFLCFWRVWKPNEFLEGGAPSFPSSWVSSVLCCCMLIQDIVDSPSPLWTSFLWVHGWNSICICRNSWSS